MSSENLKNAKGEWISCFHVNGKTFWTKSGRVWNSMSSRCKVGGSAQKNNPTYIGCTMSDNFKDFQFFAEWHMRQIGFGLPNYELDKDILIDGNKLYSEDTCALVPAQLNYLFNSNVKKRGDYPKGVCFHRRHQKFQATISLSGKTKGLGYFATIEEAEARYLQAKSEEIQRWIKLLESKLFLVDPRIISKLKSLNWR